MIDRDALQRMERELVDKGKLIEAGWLGLQLACIPLNAPDIQLEEMRNAFFAGAQHLFGCIAEILEPGEDPTDKDLERMNLIDQELRAFIRDFENRRLKPEDSA
jgi:hypothetical protein